MYLKNLMPGLASTAVVAAGMAIAAPVAQAATIVLSNDDGLTSNTLALYRALKAEGHDVIVAVPCMGQSGMGAAVVARPIGPLAADCLNGAARKGEPGAGPMTRTELGPDFFYVSGTPVMALLYGLDVQAKARWGKAPDLVLSGPNEGHNLGFVSISSGTVGIVQYAAARKIPAIALSASDKTRDNPGLANPDSTKIAALSMKLVRQILTAPAGRPLLKPGTALNVNFPEKLDNAPWRVTSVGSYTPLLFKFVPDLSLDPAAKALGMGSVSLPGLTFDRTDSKPGKGQANDEGWWNRQAITVSVMQVGYGQASQTGGHLKRAISRLQGR